MVQNHYHNDLYLILFYAYGSNKFWITTYAVHIPMDKLVETYLERKYVASVLRSMTKYLQTAWKQHNGWIQFSIWLERCSCPLPTFFFSLCNSFFAPFYVPFKTVRHIRQSKMRFSSIFNTQVIWQCFYNIFTNKIHALHNEPLSRSRFVDSFFETRAATASLATYF